MKRTEEMDSSRREEGMARIGGGNGGTPILPYYCSWYRLVFSRPDAAAGPERTAPVKGERADN